MSVRAVFFDLDGTLLDTAYDLGNALNALLKSKGQPALPLDSIRDHVSNGAAALVKMGFGVTPDSPDYNPLREQLLEFYLSNLSTHTTPFEGIETLIEKLAKNDIAWGIVTNKPWPYTSPLMKDFHFASPPVAVICPDHVEQRKPHPEALLLACDKAGCRAEQTIYIGDHERDIECGRRAGAKTIAVGYGYIPAKDSYLEWGADYTVEHAAQIWPLIEQHLDEHSS